MNIRKTFFWLHLILGCSALIFIFLMSITGAALTYERQMIRYAEQLDYPTPPTANANKLSLDDITQIASKFPYKKSISITLRNEESAFIQVKDGRKTLGYLNPYTGEEISEPGKSTKVFMKKLRAFHRWLTLDGSFSQNGRWVNGIANAIFLFLILSGMYLWLPKRINKRSIKQKLTFAKSYSNVNARDYQWHNVFGIYLTPVLFVLVFTAFFFSFKWPGNTLKEIASTNSSFSRIKPAVSANSAVKSYEQLLTIVKQNYSNWQSIQFNLPQQTMDSLLFSVDLGNGGEPQKRYSMLINSQNGEILQQSSFADLSPYRKARSYIRFLHTGEVYGITGQTIAGLASLLACLLVYTGLMLSLRRWKNYKQKQGTKGANIAQVS